MATSTPLRRTCLITGTTHGIGLATARSIARAGHTIVMANRSLQRSRLIEQHLRETTGNENVSSVQCDLASMASVRACASEVIARHQCLDLLINNAGMITAIPEVSADGIELTFATNHLGPFLLTQLLLGMLRAAPNARIVNLASNVHGSGVLDLDHLTPGKRYRWPKTYSRSKLANVMTTLTLARVLEGTGVTANCLHPGIVASNIVPRNSPILHWAGKRVKGLMRTPEQGAATTLHLALSPDVRDITGKYFDANQNIVEPSPRALDRCTQNRLWQKSLQLAGLEQPDLGEHPVD
ncbi:MAG: SDR family NAD(P)-dependent oxidoreductase [Gammaproteobacteria bacterium]|nr:SDR family NAD(P)-dependent oxidoreductase [Gammaproteobacteria bacterium]